MNQFDAVDRAPLYDGNGFPLDGLSPTEFEKFVFSCLLCVEDVHGLKITGKPSGTGDGGFDVQGEVIATNRLVCVQCKRQKEPLGIPQIAAELAKVAATAALEGSDVGEHRFICTGGIQGKLRKQLRETLRRQLSKLPSRGKFHEHKPHSADEYWSYGATVRQVVGLGCRGFNWLVSDIRQFKELMGVVLDCRISCWRHLT